MSSPSLGRRSHFPTGWRHFVGGGLALLVVGFHTGCASGEYTYVTTTAYGERLQIPLIKGAPERAKKGSITVETALLLPGSDRESPGVFYVFSYLDTRRETPKAVRVEDVSDDDPILIHEDLDPKLIDERWSVRTPLMTASHPALVWTSYLGDTFRVYRFTITKADGEQVILNQGWSVAAWTKASIRKTLGIDK